jgi:hypothetical protein
MYYVVTLTKNVFGYILGNFSQTHLVTLLRTLFNTFRICPKIAHSLAWGRESEAAKNFLWIPNFFNYDREILICSCGGQSSSEEGKFLKRKTSQNFGGSQRALPLTRTVCRCGARDQPADTKFAEFQLENQLGSLLLYAKQCIALFALLFYIFLKTIPMLHMLHNILALFLKI